MGQMAVTQDPRDPSKNGDPFDPWPMTHWPVSISAPLHSICIKNEDIIFAMTENSKR